MSKRSPQDHPTVHCLQALPVISSGAMSPTSSCSVDEAILGADTFELALPADLRGSQHARGNATGSALAVRNGGITKASRARSRPATPPLAIPVSFKWLAPSRSKDRPLQGNAKSNATVLLTGCRLDISVNSLLLEDNAMFEAMVPPAVTANGLTLAHPPRLFLAATLLCLMDGIPNEELVERYGLRDIPKMREGHPLDKAIMKRLFPRRKKGTTKYELSEGIAALFRDRNLAWPAFTITDAQAEYLIGKYGKQAVDQ